MIVKESSKSIKLRKLEALLRMLSPTHPKQLIIEKEWNRAHSGYMGEKSVDYFLKIFPKEDFLIIHDIRLQHEPHSYFQIDILLISPYFLLILEVKNISGTLIFDRLLKQLIRIKEDKEEVFPDPISQIYRQKYLLRNWLEKNHFPSTLPIESLVIIANPSTRIKTIPENTDISHIVMHSPNLLSTVQRYFQDHKSEILGQKELKKLSKLIIKRHTQDNPDPFKKFELTENELIKGVRCPSCDVYPMIRKKRQWFCIECKSLSKYAHTQHLKDFSLLIGPVITNQQCCDFLQLSSRYVARHLLKSLNTRVEGSKRHTKYFLEFKNKDF